MRSPAPILADEPYVAYCYSYPHKTAHRPLEPPVPLESLWRDEDRSRLFLYLHVPFCASRCGFCNLFSLAAPDSGLVTQHLAQLRAQASAVREALAGPRFARLAIGGGTPTLLSSSQLDALFDIATDSLDLALPGIPVSCEVSPTTVTREKLDLLARRGVTRLSMGVQTFDAEELARLGRQQSSSQALRAIEAARRIGFPTINVDLIYGIPGQTVDGWLRTVSRAIRLRPEELYLYPLYVRPLTASRDEGRPPQPASRQGIPRVSPTAAGVGLSADVDADVSPLRCTRDRRPGLLLPVRRHDRPGMWRPFLYAATPLRQPIRRWPVGRRRHPPRLLVARRFWPGRGPAWAVARRRGSASPVCHPHPVIRRLSPG